MRLLEFFTGTTYLFEHEVIGAVPLSPGESNIWHRSSDYVGLKQIPDGIFSNWLTDALQVGEVVEVMTPAGYFGPPGPGYYPPPRHFPTPYAPYDTKGH